MIIFGTNSKVLSATAAEFSCESCSTTKQVLYVLQNYFHMFWVPTFPLRKKVVLECEHCKKVVLEKEMSTQQKNQFVPAKKTTKAPIYMFAGTFIIAAMFAYGSYNNKLEKRQIKAYAQAPKNNDLVVLENTDEKYQIIKLINTSKNPIEFKIGTYEYDTALGAERAISKKQTNEKDYFSEDIFQASLEKFQELSIKYIHRDSD